MPIEQKVLTTPTFIHGRLLPAGVLVNIDTEAFKDEDGNTVTDEKAFPNLAEVGEAPVLMPTAVAAIGPTGPAPTMPQTIPPGAMQQTDGYVSGGALLVAEGHPDLAEMQKGAEELNAGVEEEQVARLNATTQDAGAAGSGTNGTETGALGEGQPFSGDTYVAGTIGDADFSGLTAEQLDAVQAAETAGQNRSGMIDKIEAARAAL